MGKLIDVDLLKASAILAYINIILYIAILIIILKMMVYYADSYGVRFFYVYLLHIFHLL